MLFPFELATLFRQNFYFLAAFIAETWIFPFRKIACSTNYRFLHISFDIHAVFSYLSILVGVAAAFLPSLGLFRGGPPVLGPWTRSFLLAAAASLLLSRRLPNCLSRLLLWPGLPEWFPNLFPDSDDVPGLSPPALPDSVFPSKEEPVASLALFLSSACK